MLYTTMPLEQVLDGLENQQDRSIMISQGGITMQVEPLAPGVGRIVRLIEAGLNDYLRPELTPGSPILFAAPSEGGLRSVLP
ncbi:YlzJ-like family protein [Paenibacillus sabuli]|nr:YlzJ-like family protein [Paenibacillus sabuli]